MEGRPSDIQIASQRVAAIVEAAERAADELRAKTEQRARERIAEADRAGDLRVDAAEAEALEILAEAQRAAAAAKAEAEAAVAQIHDRARADRAAAEARKESALMETLAETERLKSEADEYARDIVAQAKEDARDVIREAHAAAREVLHEGGKLHGDLNDLSSSLRKNAERLLNDVKLAHARLTADLDEATPAGAPSVRDSRPSSRNAAEPPAAGDFDVPEFIPRKP